MASYTGGAREASRIQALEAERAAVREKVERQRQSIAKAKEGDGDTATTNFVSTAKSPISANANSSSMLTQAVVGLVSHDDYKARRLHRERHTIEAREALQKSASSTEASKKVALSLANEKKANRKSFGKRRAADVKPSFAHSDSDSNSDSDEAKRVPKRPRRLALAKNPTADDSFLPPDRTLESAKQSARTALRSEWRAMQDVIKAEKVRIVYSYWNGSGHRSDVHVEKGVTVGKFLSVVQREFKEIRHVQVDSLMFIKEDLIIPHHITFYDLIVNKARGKSGPLFEFDAADDIRTVGDSRKERSDTHAGKVVERRWYERNRHIFPASRWELWDAEKNYGDTYTISG